MRLIIDINMDLFSLINTKSCIKRVVSMFLITAILLSILSGGFSTFNPIQSASARIPNTATTANCQKLPISSVTASGNDGHVPANVLDNNLNTRWSNRGIGSFIQADLGAQKTICSVRYRVVQRESARE